MILIKGGRVVDPKSGMDMIMDILIEDGKIKNVRADLQAEGCDRVIDASGCIVAPGLIDVHVHFRDFNQAYKEDILTGAMAAAKGGFTTVICMANTNPPVDNADMVELTLKKAEKAPVHVLTAANITVGMRGKELTDLEALKKAGAAGFTDDGVPIRDVQVLKKAMEEAVRLDLPISLHEEDGSFITNNGINAGKVAEKLGIKGSPAVAEDSMVARDCMIALHTGADINIQHISSKGAVRAVRMAKELGAHVYAEATPHHFTLTEDAVLEYGALAKMNPPLRSEEDRQAILKGLQDGTIDMIATDHAPHSREEKEKPLIEAPSGIIGLETALALGVTELVDKGYLTVIQLIEKMSLNPARLYRLDKGYIRAGAEADLVIFHEKESFTVKEFASKAANSPFAGKQLKGKVKYTICGGRIVYEDKE